MGDIGHEWARRDGAVVWHGFTPMDDYLAGEPIVVDRAEGHHLVGVDGTRYLDAISSLWVNTLGHHVPELDDAVRRQLDRVAHSTLLGHGNRVVVELAEALAAVVPVDDARFLFAGDGASAVEQALKIAFQYWVNLGRPERNRFLAFGGAYHGDTVGALSLGDGGLGPTTLGSGVFDPLRFPVLRAPTFDDDPDFKVAVDLVHEHAGELAAVVVEPLVQGAAGMRLAPAASFARLAGACRETGTLLVYDEVATGFGRTGTLFAADQCGGRPDLLCLGKGLTAGYLAMSATVVAGRVAATFGPGAGTWPTATPTAATPWPRRSPSATCSFSPSGGCSTTWLPARPSSAACSTSASARSPASSTSACAGSWVGSTWPAVPSAAATCAPPPPGPASSSGRSARLSCSCPRSPSPRPRSSASSTSSAAPSMADRVGSGGWAAWADDQCRRVAAAGQWRTVRDRDAAPSATFASNDYLGLSQHPAVVAAAHAALDRWGAGAGSARLVAGARSVHSELEAELADWKGTEAALLFPTGYAANLGVLTTFGPPAPAS